MKQFNKIAVFAILFLATSVYGSRLPEIEQYYMDKVSGIMNMRFPSTPFTVFVQLDVGDKEQDYTRKKEIKRGGDQIIQLPYLEVEDEEVTVWNRTDIAMGTLIGLLEKVTIRVQIDSEIADEDLKDLQGSIAKQLRLDPQADTIEIAKVDFNAKERTKQKAWIVIGILCLLGALFAIFWLLSKYSIKQLVSGLSQPISEIGKSTQEFANNALNIAQDLASGPSLADKNVNQTEEDAALTLGSNLIEIRKSALELLERNKNMFKSPDSRFMHFLEQQGQENPTQVGAILAELDQESIKTLYKYGWGEWWFIALAQPSPLTPVSIRILSEIDRLRVRWHFNDSETNKGTVANKEAGLVFGRMSEDELVAVLKDVAIQDAEPILDLLPRTQALGVAKKLYPGQWAKLLESQRTLSLIKPDLVERLMKKSVETKPLRKESQIQSFFADLDLVKYLDTASPRDEKDFYTVLPPESRIRSDRVPFFKIFEAPEDVRKIMGGEINAKDWALVLAGCETNEKESMLSVFSDRLRFLVNEEMAKVDYSKIDGYKIKNIRKAIIQSYIRNNDGYWARMADNNVKTTQKAA